MGIIPGGGGTEPGVAVRHYENDGAPSNGTSGTLAGIAKRGAVLADTDTPGFYQNAGTQASPVWSAILADSSEEAEEAALLAALPVGPVADVATADAADAVGDPPTQAEYALLVDLANETKAQLNALLAALRTSTVLAP